MSILIFFIVLSVLVIVHELGHFLAARAFGVRVDEFGLGYPPRARKLFKWRGTLFTLNWLPFGGFVKIFGEDPSEENLKSAESFQTKNRGIQAAVLAAGVFFNLIFAWILISVALAIGLPAPAGLTIPIENPQTVVTTVVPNSPAAEAGLKSGDAILTINGAKVMPEDAVRIITDATGPLDFEVSRGKTTSHFYMLPKEGIVEGHKAVGISMEIVGTTKLSLIKSFWEGAKITYELTILTTKALVGFVAKAFIGRADLSNVTGPVGLVGLVGDARELGFGYLLSFVAMISLNLSLINLLPFPALDGGRLLFVLVETVTRRRVPARVFNLSNSVGFALLVILMILVTVHDVKSVF